jgi:nitroreductase / dihydropteridine reductase
MKLIESLNWRYATKRMNGQHVPQEKLDVILEAIRLSASSMGLQPYRVIVVSDPLLKAKIHAEACAQPQVLEGSHLLVFASWANITADHSDEYIQRIATERELPLDSLKGFSDMLSGSITSRTTEQNADWATRQAYIGLGFGLTAAAIEQVDATPMEGFNPEAMDKLLGLKEKNLHSVALLALGYRDAENDRLSKARKIRLSKEKFFTFNA